MISLITQHVSFHRGKQGYKNDITRPNLIMSSSKSYLHVYPISSLVAWKGFMKVNGAGARTSPFIVIAKELVATCNLVGQSFFKKKVTSFACGCHNEIVPIGNLHLPLPFVTINM